MMTLAQKFSLSPFSVMAEKASKRTEPEENIHGTQKKALPDSKFLFLEWLVAVHKNIFPVAYGCFYTLVGPPPLFFGCPKNNLPLVITNNENQQKY